MFKVEWLIILFFVEKIGFLFVWISLLLLFGCFYVFGGNGILIVFFEGNW